MDSQAEKTGIEKPPAWNRKTTAQGQLSWLSTLSNDFVSDLEKISPWLYKNKGRDLGTMGRRIEQLEIDGEKYVMKETRYSGKKLKTNPKLVTNSSPVAQFVLVNDAMKRYKNLCNTALPVETPLAYFIDRTTTKRYIFYPYYESANEPFEPWDGEYQRNCKIASLKAKTIARNLQSLGFYLGESQDGGGNYVIVKDNSLEGIGVVFIDTENWRYSQ